MLHPFNIYCNLKYNFIIALVMIIIQLSYYKLIHKL